MSQRRIRLSMLRCKCMCCGIVHFYLSNDHKCPRPLKQCNQSTKRNMEGLTTCFFAVLAADSPGDGGFPEEARRVLRGSEAVSEERVRSEGLLSVSLTAAPHFHYGSTTASTSSCLIINVFFSRDLTVFLTV